MCGIAGYYTPEHRADPAVVRAMCDRIVHRGPDDEGTYADGGCAIGMRRLSIIDLATGHQPISNEDDTVWVVFNGEIYNYQPLRRELMDRGHRFKTNSDTETLIHLYEEEGPAALSRLRGMFAFAIWDARRRCLMLARDAFGKKPLYYSARPEGIYFASELKCLRETPVPFEIDEEALRLYFLLSYIPEPWSAYRDIRKLPPASWLIYHAGGRIETGSYWKLPAPAERAAPGFTEDAAAGELRQLFDDSVRIRMIADVPLGAFLSGGIDSSSVVASMALQSKEPVKTFSIGWEESAFNELPAARMVAEKYQTDHHEIVVRPNAIELVEKLVDHFDEPFGDSSAIPTYIVSEFAARHVKVALTGDGGDELFGGYDSFQLVDRLRRFDKLPQAARGVLSVAARWMPYSAYGKNYLRMISRPTPLERYFELHYTPHFLRERLLKPGWMLNVDTAFLRRSLGSFLPGGGADVLTEAMYFETAANLPGDMLVKVDRMSMANSLEVRCPLLDVRLAELAARIPHAWKMQGGRGKRILLKAIGDRLPPALLTLPKKGFGVPLADWFRGPLKEFVWDHLTSREFAGRDIVSMDFVRHLLTEHNRQRRNNYHWLWRLLMLEMWFRQQDAGARQTESVASIAPA